MANLFKSLKPHADLGHSVFDLSQKHVFSSKSACGFKDLNKLAIN